jgi:outer membrane protein assembly complex protein YaeT
VNRRGIRSSGSAALLVVRIAGLAFVLALQAFAQYAGKRIASVAFDPPLQPLPLAELRQRSGLAEGDEFDAARIRRAIEGLYATGRFLDIIVDAKDVDGEVQLTFRTVNRWFTGAQSVVGAKDPPSETQLLNVARLRLGEEFTEAKVRQAVESMTNLLRKNGLLEATVTAETERDFETESVNIRFVIEPGNRARFGEPTVRGQTELDAGDVLRASRWKRYWGLGPFHAITQSRVEEGLGRIRRKLERRDHLQASVDLLGMDWNRDEGIASPTLDIRDGPRVAFATEGFRLSKGKLRSLVPVFQERSVDRELLTEGARNIELYLNSQGFFDARASFRRESAPGRETIFYDIDRGPRYRLTSLEIEGNRYFSEETIRERMAVVPASWPRYPNGRFSDDLLRRDVATIENLYRSNGFLRVRVTPEIVPAAQSELEKKATIVVEEGPQTIVESITIRGVEGDDLALAERLMETSAGQPLSEELLAEDRQAVLNAFYNRGYTDATFDWAVTRTGEDRARVEIEIARGEQRFVNRVLVSGVAATDSKLVYRRIGLRPGDPLSLSEILDSQKRLYDLGIFARVDTGIQNPGGEETAKNVLIEIEESKKYSYNLGFGAQVGRIGGRNVQNFDSPAGVTGFSPRVNAGITRNNAWGIGHSATLQGRVSNIQSRAQLTYLAPRFRDRDSLSLAFSSFYDNSRDVRTFQSTRIEAAAQLSQRLSRANAVQARYILRRVSVDPDSLKIRPQLIPILAQPVRLGIVGGTFIQDRRDDPIDSKRGYYNSADAAVALGFLGSQSDFARLLFRNSSYYPLTRNLVFARGVTFGVQDRIKGGPLNDIPLPERFFAGGANSHRGFAENQAGPRDLETGFPVGGKAVMVFNHELRYPLIGDSLGAVLFHDMGNVYSNFKSMSFRYTQRGLDDFDYMVQSVGLGIRYRTPIGPIRFDLAFSPNTPRFFGFEGTREELIAGGGVRTLQRLSHVQFFFSLGQAF